MGSACAVPGHFLINRFLRRRSLERIKQRGYFRSKESRKSAMTIHDMLAVQFLMRFTFLAFVMASTFIVIRFRGPTFFAFGIAAAFGRYVIEPPLIGFAEFLIIFGLVTGVESINLVVSIWRAVGNRPRPLGEPGWDVRGAARGAAEDIVAGMGALIFLSAILGRYAGPLVWETLIGYELLPRLPLSLRAMKVLAGATLFRWLTLLVISGYMAWTSFR